MWQKINPQGFIDRQRREVGVGEEENIFLSRFPRSLADVFQKNEEKYKTSVYRLQSSSITVD